MGKASRGRGRPKIDGKRITRDEKILVKDKDDKWVYEHRLVMADMLGRELKPYEQVSHRDGNGLNNSPENLRLKISGYADEIQCPCCGNNLIEVEGIG